MSSLLYWAQYWVEIVESAASHISFSKKLMLLSQIHTWPHIWSKGKSPEKWRLGDVSLPPVGIKADDTGEGQRSRRKPPSSVVWEDLLQRQWFWEAQDSFCCHRETYPVPLWSCSASSNDAAFAPETFQHIQVRAKASPQPVRACMVSLFLCTSGISTWRPTCECPLLNLWVLLSCRITYKFATP